ncbi:Component of a membrane-bound complex containing the Tor2p kinase, partial [Coemansia sp. RSA 2607]
MALVNDATFLIYQLRVALVRSNDPLGARLMTFDDLAAPTGSLTAGEQQRRRQSSASSVRRQVAHNAQTNAYIAASGYSAEVDLAHSPELVDAPERPGGMGMGMSGYSGGAGRRRRVKEPEAVALADGPLAQGALAGPLPPVRRSLDTVRARPAAMVGDAADGSLSDGPTTPNGATGERQRLRAALAAGSAAASSAAASASSSATTATTTIRLQRPGGRKGSSRDAMALAVDFDVTKLAPPASSRKESSDSARKESSDAARKESSDSGRKSSDSMRRTRRIPLASLHERAGVKRSATLPAKRAARSRWAGAQAVGAQPAGWVGGPTNTWDHSSGSEDEGGRRRGATNTHTHTWYGPRTSMRASMFPVAAAVPPVPLLFGADSDDDIDLEGDEGSARTPAAMGLHAMAGATVVGPASPGMRSRSGSLASVRSRAGSLGANPQPRRASRLGLRTPQPASSVPAQPSPLATAPPGDAPHTPLVTPADAPFVPPPPPASGLAALLAGAGSARPSPLADEFAAIGAAEGVGFALSVTVHAATRVTLALRVRAGATVEQTIGFTLHRWAEEHAAAAGDAPDVAHWVLRIAEDGDVDDDFPVLDRARPVAQFGADEFALCAATPEQIRVNE